MAFQLEHILKSNHSVISWEKLEIISSIHQIEWYFFIATILYIFVLIDFWTGHFLVVLFSTISSFDGVGSLWCVISKLMHVNFHQEIRYFVRNELKTVYLFQFYESIVSRFHCIVEHFDFNSFRLILFLLPIIFEFFFIWHKKITKFQVN